MTRPAKVTCLLLFTWLNLKHEVLTMTLSNEAAEFLTGPQVQRRYQRSHVSIWRWRHDPELGFPKPIRINRLLYWRLADLEAWEAAMAMEAA